MALLMVGIAFVGSIAPVFAVETLWSTSWDGWTTFPSYTSTTPSINQEVADDFDVNGTISRLVIDGYNECPGSCGYTPDIIGVHLRIYQSSASGPGAVEHEEYFAASDPNLGYNTTSPEEIDLILHTPFVSTGRHYLSVQLEFGQSFAWYIWSAGHNAPRLSRLWYRQNNGSWGPYLDYSGAPADNDLSFTVYGCPPAGCAPPSAVNGCGQWGDVPTPIPSGASEARLRGIDVRSQTDAWAVGDYSAPGPVPGDTDDFSLAMRWNGSTWTQVATPNPGPRNGMNSDSFVSVDAVDANNAFAVGRQAGQDPQSGYFGGRVFAARWTGQQWVDMHAPWPSSVGYSGASGEQLNDVVAITANDVWMVGSYWRMTAQVTAEWPGVAFHWDGSQFQTHYLPWISPARNQWGNAVSASGTNDVWVVGDGTGSGNYSYIWHWNGGSWSQVPGPTPGRSRVLEDVVAISPNNVWAGGNYTDLSYNTHPWIIHWNGSAWSDVPTPAGGSAFAVWSANDIMTLGASGWAHWNGTTWTAEAGPELWPAGSILGIDTVSPCDLLGVGVLFKAGVATPHTVRLRPMAASDTDGDGIGNAQDNCPNDFNPDQADCDNDAVGNVCEIVAGTQHDCNGNGTPDECENFADCDLNGVPDECETDCNGNQIPDACDIAGPSEDCNVNGVPDECDTFDDCNTNGINDLCDIDGGSSQDGNSNRYPDECEALEPNDITVTTHEDVIDFGGAQTRSDLPGADGLISFHEALLAAANTPGQERIAFNIPKSRWDFPGPKYQATLRQEWYGIFNVTDDGLVVDFTTQTKFTGDTNPNGGEVAIWGYEPNSLGVASIVVQANNTTIKGLDRVGQRGYGIEIRGNNNRVLGCTIDGPLFAGVLITETYSGAATFGNIIGGTAPGEGNRLAAGNNGVRIVGNTAGHAVIGNPLLTGTITGVSIIGSPNNRIGGPTAAERNVISGSGKYGEEGCPYGTQVVINDSPNTILEGNYIGTVEDGSAAYPNQRGTEGVAVVNSDNVVVRGNLISGIKIAGFNHCNGQLFGTALLVSGNSTGTLIVGNKIGTNAAGTAAVQSVVGVLTAYDFFTATTPTRTQLGGNNAIAYQVADGVRLHPGSFSTTISQNSIHDNGGLGINLQGTGNGGQAAPVIASAGSDESHVRIQGQLTSTASRSFTLEFFANAGCDGSGSGEGERSLGSQIVTTDSTGHASFDLTLPGYVAAGQIVTSTATDRVNGNTSGFSSCRTVTTMSCSAAPPEVSGLMIASDKARLSWNAFGPSIRYEVARGFVGTMPSEPASCLATGLIAPQHDDSTTPVIGQSFYYMVRARNTCGAGAWSPSSSTATCP